VNCPSCGKASSVLETRRSPNGTRRRRVCACGGKFTTLEIVVPDNPNFRGELRLIPTFELTRLRRLLDRLTLADSARIVQTDFDGEQVE
jgi:transcriptional regulator NrdR family protein